LALVIFGVLVLIVCIGVIFIVFVKWEYKWVIRLLILKFNPLVKC
jgi:hypothetical protein